MLVKNKIKIVCVKIFLITVICMLAYGTRWLFFMKLVSFYLFFFNEQVDVTIHYCSKVWHQKNNTLSSKDAIN